MKTMTGIAFALATLAASPAFAQSNPGNRWDAYQSFAQQYGPQRAVRGDRRYVPSRSWGAFGAQGRYLGSDPDPNVRDMIARDPEDEGAGW